MRQDRFNWYIGSIVESQGVQRVMSAVAGTAVALLLGTGMALAASGVFKVPDHISPLTSVAPSPSPSAESTQEVPTIPFEVLPSMPGENSVPVVPVPAVPPPDAAKPGDGQGQDEHSGSQDGERHDDHCRNGGNGDNGHHGYDDGQGAGWYSPRCR